MANPNSSAQRSFAAEPYDSVAAVLTSKQITAALAGQTIFSKDGAAVRIVAAGEDMIHPETGAKLLAVEASGGYIDARAMGLEPGEDHDQTEALDRFFYNVKRSGSGGKFYIPQGVIKYSEPLDFTLPINCEIVGAGWSNTGGIGTRLLYTGTGDYGLKFTSVDARNNLIRGICFEYDNPDFAGRLVLAGNFNSAFKSCFFTGQRDGSAVGAEYLLDLCMAVNMQVEGNLFNNAQNGILGIENTSAERGSSNAVRVANCGFNRMYGESIINPGQGWVIEANYFEPKRGNNQQPSGIACNGEAASRIRGVSVHANWFGDIIDTATTPIEDAWIKIEGSGWSIKANHLNGGGFNRAAAIKVVGDTYGVEVGGNYFSNFHAAFDLGDELVQGLVMPGSDRMRNLTNYVIGTPKGGCLYPAATDDMRWGVDLQVQGFKSTGIDDAASAKVLRLTSGGGALINKTTTGLTQSGFEVLPDGTAQMSRASAPAMKLNRSTDNGPIEEFYRSGTKVGGIDVRTSGAGFIFDTSGAGVYGGAGEPNASLGTDGSVYFRTDGGTGSRMYVKASSAWTAIL